MNLSKTLFLRLVAHHPPRPQHRPISSSQLAPRRAHHHEEESRGVKVSVWWDFENCHLPSGANVFRVAQSITAAVRINGIKGPITITAFGDVLQLSRTNQEALSATGINLAHVPQGSVLFAKSLLFWFISRFSPNLNPNRKIEIHMNWILELFIFGFGYKRNY